MIENRSAPQNIKVVKAKTCAKSTQKKSKILKLHVAAKSQTNPPVLINIAKFMFCFRSKSSDRFPISCRKYVRTFLKAEEFKTTDGKDVSIAMNKCERGKMLVTLDRKRIRGYNHLFLKNSQSDHKSVLGGTRLSSVAEIGQKNRSSKK